VTVALNVRKRYSAVDAWFYDTVVAPSLAAMKPELVAEVVTALPATGEVLEVGSGGGQLCVGLAEHAPGLRVTGLDISTHQLHRARRRAAALGQRVRFVEGSAMELPFPSESFDATISYGSIKHWPDAARGIDEMLRVLASSSRAAVSPWSRRVHSLPTVPFPRQPSGESQASRVWKSLAARRFSAATVALSDPLRHRRDSLRLGLERVDRELENPVGRAVPRLGVPLTDEHPDLVEG
jgi:ubiquinone/menaquinone biosynthesis C-methylase UbiE